MTTTSVTQVFSRTEKRFVRADARRHQHGHYWLEVGGQVVGDVLRRSRTDWYAEIVVDGVFTNVCSDTFGEVLAELPLRTQKNARRRAGDSDALMAANLQRRIDSRAVTN